MLFTVGIYCYSQNSAKIIRSSVFGFDEKMKVRSRFEFPQNNLVVTSIDIQSVEPVDQRTRESLQKSVQLAIEITTNSQEAAAKHEAERLEQSAKGRLERQKISDEAEAEKSRRELLELQVCILMVLLSTVCATEHWGLPLMRAMEISKAHQWISSHVTRVYAS